MSRLQHAGPSIATLYDFNTAGAVLGVLATAFWLVPEFGLARTAAVCAALNLFCAVAALNLSGTSMPLSAAAMPLLFGVLLVPALGPKLTLLLVVAGYLALSSATAWRAPAAPAVAGAALVIAVWAPPLAFITVPEGGRVISYREGALAAVSVVEDADGVSRLRINNRQQEGSSDSLLADSRQALLPMLLHPAPERALFLGLGTGVTASSAARDPALHVDAVELLPEVIEASAHFTRALTDGTGDARLRMLAGDARRYVRTAAEKYDVIVSDNFHPARSGSGSLYTVEHFRAVRARLGPQGVFCQWLPLHQMDLETLRSIVQSFMAAYPEGAAMLATNSLETPVLGLVGRAGGGGGGEGGGGGGRFDLAAVRARLASHSLPQHLPDYGIADDFALLGGFVAGPAALLQFAGDAPMNTDDRPVVAYRAPRITYAPDSLPRHRLLELLGRLRVAPGEVIDAGNDTGWQTRMVAYRRARDAFLTAGRDVRPSADVNAMLAQVREPLLSVLRESPDFRPAYDPLLRLARAQARTAPAQARVLLAEMVQIQPARPEAGAALRELATASP